MKSFHMIQQGTVILRHNTKTVLGEVAEFRTLNRRIAVISSLFMAWARYLCDTISVSLAYARPRSLHIENI